MKTKNLLPCFLILVFMVSGVKALHAQDRVQVTSQKFIAYSLYNFSKLIDWPKSSSAKIFRITVVGDKEVYQDLVNLARNKNVGNASYDIVFCKSVEELEGDNHIIYLSNIHSGKVTNLSKDPALKNVLLVTERANMAKYGSAISFTVTDKGTLGFEIARENAKKNQLMIHTQLERMAHEVL